LEEFVQPSNPVLIRKKRKLDDIKLLSCGAVQLFMNKKTKAPILCRLPRKMVKPEFKIKTNCVTKLKKPVFVHNDKINISKVIG
jgi:hypothetical protein